MTEPPAPRTAVLQRYPVRIWARQREYMDGLLREFNLMLLGRETAASSAPARLVELADQLTSRYGPLLDAVNEEREKALLRGDRALDSRVPLVEGTPEVVAYVTQVFAEVDQFCASGDMLTLAMPEDLKALRDWSTAEILRQHDGHPPTPWPGPLE